LWTVFRDRVFWTICLAWLWTTILLISASWVARITGVSHWHSFHLSDWPNPCSWHPWTKTQKILVPKTPKTPFPCTVTKNSTG
jgi:hypothetical protein